MGRVIVVDGNIGVGKTTFIRRIAHALDMIMIAEDFEGNPYLSDFYRDQVTWAYKTQEWFIRNRFESYEKAVKIKAVKIKALSDINRSSIHPRQNPS